MSTILDDKCTRRSDSLKLWNAKCSRCNTLPGDVYMETFSNNRVTEFHFVRCSVVECVIFCGCRRLMFTRHTFLRDLHSAMRTLCCPCLHKLIIWGHCVLVMRNCHLAYMRDIFFPLLPSDLHTNAVLVLTWLYLLKCYRLHVLHKIYLTKVLTDAAYKDWNHMLDLECFPEEPPTFSNPDIPLIVGK